MNGKSPVLPAMITDTATWRSSVDFPPQGLRV